MVLVNSVLLELIPLLKDLIDAMTVVVVEKQQIIEQIVNNVSPASSHSSTVLANDVLKIRSHRVLELALAFLVVQVLRPMLIKQAVLNVSLVSILLITLFVYLVLLDHSQEEVEQHIVISAHLVTKPTAHEQDVKRVQQVHTLPMVLNANSVSMVKSPLLQEPLNVLLAIAVLNQLLIERLVLNAPLVSSLISLEIVKFARPVISPPPRALALAIPAHPATNPLLIEPLATPVTLENSL